MDQPITQVGPPEVHPDAYRVVRVATEFLLRGFDLLTEAEGDVVDGLIVMTLVRDQAGTRRRKPAGVRALSRRLDMPYTTIRRHVEALAESGRCAAKDGALIVPPAVLRGRRITTFLRKIYVNAVRLLADLTRIGVASFASSSRRPVKSGRLSKEQTAVAVAATGLLLTGIRSMRAFWGGDLMKGLVYTAIWTANVKHVTNTAPAGIRAVLPDSDRQPVSVLAISRSLRLPYETVRRHADALVQAGICVRVGRHGLLVPSRFIEGITSGIAIAYRLVKDCLAELRRAGVKV
jgi:hypothetical protein